MKKRLLSFAQAILFGLFGFSLLLILLQFMGKSNPLSSFNNKNPTYNNIEAFDPSLSRLNTLEKVEEYCDSVYAEKIFKEPTIEFEKTYVEITSNTIRNRFFHGYSYNEFGDNYVGLLLSKVTVSGWAASVEPDEILKHPFAACSQQAIVMMEVLKNKEFKTRKVAFNGARGGHFAFEVFYDGSWHFHDPNMEPDNLVLNSYGRPDIKFLVQNPDVLTRAYHRYPKDQILGIFSSFSYGQVNKFPAPKAMIFQKVTRFLSYTFWLIFLVAFLVVRRMYLRMSKGHEEAERVPVPRMRPDTTPIYYPEYKAQGA